MKVNGGQAILEVLKANEIETVFGLLGGSMLELFDAIYQDGSIRYLGARDERAAAQEAAKWILNAAAKLSHERGVEPHEAGITPDQLAGIIGLRTSGDVGSSAATELFEVLCDSDDDAQSVAESRNLLQVSDAGALDAWIDQALADQPQAAEDFAAGKDAAAGRIIGCVMKASGGAADAGMVRSRLGERLR